VPWTYCWSDGLINKPEDWKEHIGANTVIGDTDDGDISGFYFLEGESDYVPDEALEAFLRGGDPPVYVG
jgi:hypothetical protein